MVEAFAYGTGVFVALANLWAAYVIRHRYPDSRAWLLNVASAVFLLVLIALQLT